MRFSDADDARKAEAFAARLAVDLIGKFEKPYLLPVNAFEYGNPPLPEDQKSAVKSN